MIDELFMRQWNAGHDQLSADLDRTFGRLRRALLRAPRIPDAIDGTYARARSAKASPRKAANNLLGGLAAVGTTIALVLAVTLLAIPGTANSRTAHFGPAEAGAITAA